MHPKIRESAPGLCPECGMSLIILKEKSSDAHHTKHTGEFDKHAGHHTNIFRRKFWVSLILTVPIILYSDILDVLFKVRAPAFWWSEWLVVVLSSIVFFYGGWVFLESAQRELRARMPGMMTLIALAISTAYIYSMGSIILGGHETLFWELATLITIMLLGHWLEMRAVRGAQGALQELSKLLPDTAEVLKNGTTIIMPLAELREGDTVLARPGSKIPADGVVVEGFSGVDESIATGESKPVEKREGNTVIAGTINGDGALTIRVTKIGEHTFLAGVMRLVREAQASKSRLQILSDRAAYYLTLVAVGVGGTTFVSWLFVADPTVAVEHMVAVLVIACPHALGLAVPLVASISTTKAARSGFLIKQRLALEAARNINVVLFDKTGTLTRGEFGVHEIISLGASEEEVLRLAAAVDQHSEHPIAKAIVKEAKQRAISIPRRQHFLAFPEKAHAQ